MVDHKVDAERHLDSQRACSKMLRSRDGDVFYSRSDLYLRVESFRRRAKESIAAWCRREKLFGLDDDHDDDLDDRFVLHAAATMTMRPDDLHTLANDYPESLRTRDPRNDGRLPLHVVVVVVRSSASRETDDAAVASERVRALLEARHSETASIRPDDRGLLPLHLAILSCADATVTRPLVESCPSSVSAVFSPPDSSPSEGRDETYRNFLPFHMACTKGDVETIYYLLRRDPSVLLTSFQQ